MTGRRRILLTVALSAGLVLLVLAAVTGPANLFTRSGRRPHFNGSTPSGSSSASVRPDPFQEAIKAPKNHTLAWLGTLIGWGVLVLIAVGAFAVVWLLWQHRPRRQLRPPDVHFDLVPLVELERALSDERADQIAELDRGDARNGIVRCWLRLEDTVAAAGLPRLRSETSTEFTVRVLKAMDLDPRAIGRLSALFREARFSDHTLAEGARTEARAAWTKLHDELLGATRAAVAQRGRDG